MIGSHTPQAIGSLALNNPPQETPPRQYIEFSEADRILIQTASTLSHLIYKYSNDPSVIQPFLDQGWSIARDTDQERQQRNNQVLAQGSQDALSLINPRTAFQEQHTLAPRIREIGDEMLRNIEGSGYHGQFLINESLGVGLLVNKGTDPLSLGDLTADLAILSKKDCQRNRDAIAFAMDCKQECERRGIQFIPAGQSLGGYLAHLQKAIVGADVAIGFDNPLLSEDVVKQYEGKSAFSISEIKNDSGYVTTRSNPNVIQQAGGSVTYGQELCVDVLKHEPISIYAVPTVHSSTNISKEVNAGQIYSKNGSFVPLISEVSSSTSKQRSTTPPSQPPNGDRKGFFENLKDDFHKRSNDAMEIQLSTMPPVIFSPETKPTEEKLAAIEADVKALTDRGDAQELLGIAAVGEQIVQEIESELKGETGEQKALKLAQAASEIAAAIYRDQQRSLAEQQQKIQQRQWERQHEAKKDRINQKHDHQTFGLSLPAIESTVFRGIHPSGNMRSHLKSMQKNTKNYHKIQMKLNELLAIRKNRKATVDGQRKNLDDLDASIGRHYQRMMRSRQNSINALGNASTAMGILGSVLSFTPISPVASVLAGLASTGLSIARTRHEKRLMKHQAQLQKKMEGTLNTREKVAEISYQTTQEITAIESEQLEQRRILLQSADAWSNPKAYRNELATSRADHITETQAKHLVLEERKQALGSLREKACSLEAQEKGCQDQMNNAKKRKKREGYSRTLQDVRTNLSQTRIAITTLEIEVESREKELGEYRTTLEEMDSKIEREEKLSPVKDYFYQIVSNQTKKWEVKNEELRVWQENLAKGFANFSAATEEERQFFHTTLSEIEKLFRELSSSPLTRGLSFLTGNNINFGRGALYAQNAARLGEEIYRTYDCFRRWSVAAQAFSKGIDESDKNAVSESKMMLMINNVIEKLGPHSFFVMKWIIPGMQTITAGLAVLRVGTHLLTGCQRTISPEEHLLRKLEIFLEKFSKHIDVQFKHFHDHLDRNQAELLETLNCVRSELSVLSNEILYEVEHSRDRILQQLRTEFFHQHTSKIKRTGNKITEKLDRFKLDFTTNGIESKDRIEIAQRFLINLVVDLRNKTMLDVNTGVSYERNAQGLSEAKPLVDIALAAQNPDLYTGAIAISIGFNAPVPSFFLFNLLAKNDVFARRICSHGSFGIGSLKPLFEESGGLLSEQGQKLLELSRQFPSVFHMIRRKQDDIIRREVERIALTQSLKQTSLIESVRQVIQRSACIGQMTNDELRVGHHKFHMADLFCNTQIGDTYTQIPDEVAAIVQGESIRFARDAAVWGAVGFFFGGPPGAATGATMASMFNMLEITTRTFFKLIGADDYIRTSVEKKKELFIMNSIKHH